MKEGQAWYAVVGALDRILVVFGPGLGELASEETVRLARESGKTVRLELVIDRKPRVGEILCSICRGDPCSREGSACYGCGLPSQMGS